MKRIAIYGKNINEAFFPAFRELVKGLKAKGTELTGESGFVKLLESEYPIEGWFDGLFSQDDLAEQGAEMLLSIGGDGTFLHSLLYVKDSGIPVLGINSGRLGFLANVPEEEIGLAVEYISGDRYEVEPRSLLRLEAEGEEFPGFQYGLNEVTVQKTDTSSLLRIHAYVDDIYLTTYWADGLIVATPTGSTAYSLSGGGPIVSPECRNIILTPVCPHNLSVRALVVPDTAVIRLEIESRSGDFMLSLDSGITRMKDKCRLKIMAAPFKLNVVRFPGHPYYETLRNKLGWGEDKRNRG